MQQALSFYTNILDFELSYPETEEDPVVLIKKENIEIQLSIYDGGLKSAVNIWVDEVDNLFAKYIERGLDTSHKKNSPVHQGPVDQSWGMREFYVTDQDGNTLRFGTDLKP
jgi:catechol 2,3-dioxygenase-like lactoylglutathione lyase family enzyme